MYPSFSRLRRRSFFCRVCKHFHCTPGVYTTFFSKIHLIFLPPIANITLPWLCIGQRRKELTENIRVINFFVWHWQCSQLGNTIGLKKYTVLSRAFARRLYKITFPTTISLLKEVLPCCGHLWTLQHFKVGSLRKFMVLSCHIGEFEFVWFWFSISLSKRAANIKKDTIGAQCPRLLNCLCGWRLQHLIDFVTYYIFIMEKEQK